MPRRENEVVGRLARLHPLQQLAEEQLGEDRTHGFVRTAADVEELRSRTKLDGIVAAAGEILRPFSFC
jgi:hypothetical protein